MAGFYMIGDIELKSVYKEVESFKRKVKLNSILNSSIEKNEHKLLLYSYHIGTVLPVLLSFRKKSINLSCCFVFLSRCSFGD